MLLSFLLLVNVTDVAAIKNVTKTIQLSMYTYTVDAPDIPTIASRITKEENHINLFQINSSFLKNWPTFQLQFNAEAVLPQNQTGERYPLLVTTYWHGSARSWEVPISFRNEMDKLYDQNNHDSEQTLVKSLWDYPVDNWTLDSRNLTVDMDVNYTMKVVPVNNFGVRAGHNVTAVANLSSPSFFLFEIPPNWQFVFIHATSKTNTCAIMGVRKLEGPFLDQMNDHTTLQLHETFTLNAGLTVTADLFRDGFLLVFYPLQNSGKCTRLEVYNNSLTDFDSHYKEFQFLIQEGMQVSSYSYPLLFTMIPIFLFGFLAFFCHSRFEEKRASLFEGEYCLTTLRVDKRSQTKIKMDELLSNVTSNDVDQSQRYFSVFIFLHTAFYIIPVVILMMTFMQQYLATGNLDTCYFNEACSHKLGVIQDFNHIYSNIGYIFFGTMFMVIVRKREMSKTANLITQGKGVFVHYDLLYCVGFSLTMTGCMSAIYHVCPNKFNFIFDVFFMYKIAAIAIVTMYQFRYPTYLSSDITFATLAIVTIVAVLGLLWDNVIVRICFSIMHIIFLVFVLATISFNGYIRRNGQLVLRLNQMLPIIFSKFVEDFKKRKLFQYQKETWRAPGDPEIEIVAGSGRLVFPTFLFIVNVLALIIMWTLLANLNFATQVLLICVTNGSSYGLFYYALKIYYGECRRILSIQPCCFLVSSLIFWVAAVNFFIDVNTEWEKSPARSRIKNMDCMLLSFFDTHDIWHFFSSAALFCDAMVLLTIDDDLVDQPKSTIPVF
ncbi:unnamed protein product [Orchesella dallaii]|uniref:SID1 transmembrane family member 1 n=1 Tax=Orchesella dallaii TaxID=48710 RepID=A0ABP1PTE9_9HEXA